MTKLGATTHPLHPKFFIPIRNIHREKSSGCSRMMLYQFHPLLGKASKASSNPGGGEPAHNPLQFWRQRSIRRSILVWTTDTTAGWWFQPHPSEKWWTSSGGIIIQYNIPNVWKVIKFHGSSHHLPDRAPGLWSISHVTSASCCW